MKIPGAAGSNLKSRDFKQYQTETADRSSMNQIAMDSSSKEVQPLISKREAEDSNEFNVAGGESQDPRPQPNV